ncbi:hypothetical protein DFA_03637 [Cavenderia fasciculata]|uniref:Prolyl 4-hydroxylase alpha subunit domain-containing protein n=1 Tax=Cavenderia fasciculata TaxID=261658 RepID=F4PIF9_CACFS|nr:uncharacterized protein DFA_03637 [Cavenderia fasciculata]EGG25388.1 hypothetical protein DFA_03637 [Cavenderia fasciculata]|eukprot:XP_004363239.1 hypothetical protein DFA_03637 [Cavenderia fasciculata]
MSVEDITKGLDLLDVHVKLSTIFSAVASGETRGYKLCDVEDNSLTPLLLQLEKEATKEGEISFSEQCDMTIKVDGVDCGTLAKPNIEKLISMAHPAPFGKGTEKVYDETVRKGLQITANRIQLGDLPPSAEQVRSGYALVHYTYDQSATNLTKTLQQTNYHKDMLDIFETYNSTPSLRLYKIHIYQEGGFFDEHIDTQVEHSHVGTFILPIGVDTYEGGEFQVGSGLKLDENDCRSVKLNVTKIPEGYQPPSQTGGRFMGSTGLHQHSVVASTSPFIQQQQVVQASSTSPFIHHQAGATTTSPFVQNQVPLNTTPFVPPPRNPFPVVQSHQTDPFPSSSVGGTSVSGSSSVPTSTSPFIQHQAGSTQVPLNTTPFVPPPRNPFPVVQSHQTDPFPTSSVSGTSVSGSSSVPTSTSPFIQHQAGASQVPLNTTPFVPPPRNPFPVVQSHQTDPFPAGSASGTSSVSYSSGSVSSVSGSSSVPTTTSPFIQHQAGASQVPLNTAPFVPPPRNPFPVAQSNQTSPFPAGSVSVTSSVSSVGPVNQAMSGFGGFGASSAPFVHAASSNNNNNAQALAPAGEVGKKIDLFKAKYVAMFNDCPHRVLPVTKGTRIVLQYNVIMKDAEDKYDGGIKPTGSSHSIFSDRSEEEEEEGNSLNDQDDETFPSIQDIKKKQAEKKPDLVSGDAPTPRFELGKRPREEKRTKTDEENQRVLNLIAPRIKEFFDSKQDKPLNVALLLQHQYKANVNSSDLKGVDKSLFEHLEKEFGKDRVEVATLIVGAKYNGTTSFEKLDSHTLKYGPVASKIHTLVFPGAKYGSLPSIFSKTAPSTGNEELSYNDVGAITSIIIQPPSTN